MENRTPTTAGLPATAAAARLRSHRDLGVWLDGTGMAKSYATGPCLDVRTNVVFDATTITRRPGEPSP
ncbi:hypothetical protein BH20ACT2_BH20ACT2_13130 [soil metagenome]